MNIVLITTGMRPDLLNQTLLSLYQNASNMDDHHVTVVCDGRAVQLIHFAPQTIILNLRQQGASACRNIGAGSIPKYRRQEHVLFLDDDVYMCKGWDQRLMELARFCDSSIVSGYSHPFNNCEPITYTWNGINHGVPLVISSVAMMMTWAVFDAFGPWDEPGGPGGSEDYALCMRAKRYDHGFAVTDPQCVLHCGLISSKGEKIVGYQELAELNDKLMDIYGIRGKVIFQ